MKKKRILCMWVNAVGLIVIGLLYLLLWPVPVEPVAWDAPVSAGYTGDFQKNHRLKPIELLDIGENEGPESIAVNSKGEIFAAMHSGNIVRLSNNGKVVKNWVNTKGRPLGIVFDERDNLIVADAFEGLLMVGPSKKITLLSNQSDTGALCYVNNADVAKDGKIYFSDSSSKFCAKAWGGTYEASLLDIMEHGGHGRLLVYDPADKSTKTLITGLHFANGVAISPDQSFLLVNETGTYRVLKYWLQGDKEGTYAPVIENLPSFPDNLTTGSEGRFWIALVSPRSVPLDAQSGNPFVRKIIQRLPAAIRPKAMPYGHIVAIDRQGKVLLNLQDPEAAYPINTEVLETEHYLYLGSLFADKLGRIQKLKIGL